MSFWKTTEPTRVSHETPDEEFKRQVLLLGRPPGRKERGCFFRCCEEGASSVHSHTQGGELEARLAFHGLCDPGQVARPL